MKELSLYYTQVIENVEPVSLKQIEYHPPLTPLSEIGPFIILETESLTDDAVKLTKDYYMANEVYRATVIDRNTKLETQVVIKIAKPGIEQREKSIIFTEGKLGGWLRERLLNEYLLLQLVHNQNIPCPKPLYYEWFPDQTEILVEEQLLGEKCLALRTAPVSEVDRNILEASKGQLLGQINRLDASSMQFGPINKNSMHFPTWQEYFNYKLSGTLSIIHGMYNQISRLEYFPDIATSEEEWRQKVEIIAQMYSGNNVQSLLKKDGEPTVTHGDFWDSNIMARKEKGKWNTSVFDFERGDISGKSLDLALWLEWKIGGDRSDPNPIEASKHFMEGYTEAKGYVSPHIKDMITMYALWQYLEFLIADGIFGIDRSDESVHEITKLTKQLEALQ